MHKRIKLIVLIICILFTIVTPGMAAIGNITPEKWSREILTDKVNQINTLIGNTARLNLKNYLEDVRDSANALLSLSDISDNDGIAMKRSLTYAIKLATDIQNTGDANLWASAPFVMYEVPALSSIKRELNVLPEDGTVTDELAVISAQGEFEAASFILAPLSDAGSVTFTVSDLTGEGGTIPASAIDLRVVKYWYQGGTAWYSYFADKTRKVMVPELLLHDENLIKVDKTREGNSIRVDYPTGSVYVDISNDPATKLSHYTEPIADSQTLLPVSLKQGESKQMWLTTNVPKETAGGLYSGKIDIIADGVPAGSIDLNIRVLPFELPKPKTYYDKNKDFYVMLYHASRYNLALSGTGGNVARAETKLLNEYKNMVEHNVINLPGPGLKLTEKAYFERQLQLMQQAGMSTKPLFGVYQSFPSYEPWYMEWSRDKNSPTFKAEAERFKGELKSVFDYVSNLVGHTDIYFDGWDEAWWNMLLYEQDFWQYIQSFGGKVFATGHGEHFKLPVKENFLNYAGDPTREKAATWHSYGSDKLITNYAYPHTGPENPDMIRQRHGMWMYKANYDAVYNYIFYEGPNNIWNDNAFTDTFRNFNLAYPTQTDLIDTIAWEGLREGIDDIKYATKLKLVAADALASGNAARITAANNALNYLENVNERKVNQDTLRLEMIGHILRMLDLQNAK